MNELNVPIRTEYIGGNADQIVQPTMNSQPRVQMFTSHSVQSPYVDGTEPPLLFTGVELEYSRFVMGAKVKDDCRILYIARRFSNSNAIKGDPVQYTIFVNPIGTNLIDVIDFELYQSDHQYFGFNYELNRDVKLSQDAILRKDTWLVKSPKVKGESNIYSIGVHANTVTASYPGCIEDAIEISDEWAELMSSWGYRTSTFRVGPEDILLLPYKVGNELRAYPRRGEFVRDDGILIAKRKWDPMLAAVECNTMALTEVCGRFDDPITVEPGSEVIDVKIIKSYADNHSRMDVAVKSCADDLTDCQHYYKQILEFYASIEPSLPQEDGTGQLKRRQTDGGKELTPEAHNIITNALARFPDRVTREKSKYRSQMGYMPIDEYYIEITTRYKIPFTVGNKMTDCQGGKGINARIRPVADMPIDEHGNRVHVILSSLAVMRRTNFTRTFAIFINAARRDLQNQLIDIYKHEGLVVAWDLLMEFLDAVSPIWKDCVEKTHVTDQDRVALLEELYYNKLTIAIPHETRKMADEIQNDVLAKFPPTRSKLEITLPNGEKTLTKTEHLVGELYFIRLDKTGKEMSAIASGTSNHFGTITRQSQGDRCKRYFREHGIVWMGEAEAKHQAAYIGGHVLEEHHDRANNPIVKDHIVENIYSAKNPFDIKSIVDRERFPLGNNSGVKLVRSMLKSGGVKLTDED